jgi:hypothetical protein
MTIEQGVEQAVVKIRTSRYALIQQFLIAGLFFVLGASTRTGGDQLGLAPFWPGVRSSLQCHCGP